MKQAFLLCALGIAASTAIAQPTLTAATSIPTAGLNVTLHYTALGTTSVVGGSGANQNWDLSGLSFTRRTENHGYRSCGSSDDCARYPGTTILASHPQMNGVQSYYFAGSSTALMRIGNKDSVSGTSFHHIFTDAQEILRFPMGYNSGFVDAFAAIDTATNGTTTHYRRGNDTVLADGWGTLKTPSGTFTNVLRVKEIIHERDSSYRLPTGVIVDSLRYEVYSWYDAAHKHLLAQTTEIVYSGNVQSFSAYADVPGSPAGVTPHAFGSIDFDLAPNPVRGNATLSLRLASAAEIRFGIINIMGQVVYQSEPERLASGVHKFMLPTQGLPNGLYTLRINANGTMLSGKLVIE